MSIAENLLTGVNRGYEARSRRPDSPEKLYRKSPEKSRNLQVKEIAEIALSSDMQTHPARFNFLYTFRILNIDS